MGEYGPGCILTASGRFFDPIRPDPALIVLEDIGHALGNICRFTGHCRRPYSVAEHVMLGAMFVPEEHLLAWLMHDASEAYLGDVSSPLKRWLGMKDYRWSERHLQGVICGKFGVRDQHPRIVTEVDERMLATEMRDLMPERAREFFASWHFPEPFDFTISSAPDLCIDWGLPWVMSVTELLVAREVAREVLSNEA